MVQRLGGPSQPEGIFGIAGGQLLTLDTVSGEGRAITDLVDAWDVHALTYDPEGNRLYGLMEFEGRPTLMTHGLEDGETRRVGPLRLQGSRLQVADALAWDAVAGRLLVTAGDSTFASRLLLEVDPETAVTSRLATLSGTAQGELDAMVFIHGFLVGVDNSGRTGRLYSVDPATGSAVQIGEPFKPHADDLAFDTTSGTLFALHHGTRRLSRITSEGVSEPVGPVRGAKASDGTGEGDVLAVGGLAAVMPQGPPTPVAKVPRGALFTANFESGDTWQWTLAGTRVPAADPRAADNAPPLIYSENFEPASVAGVQPAEEAVSSGCLDTETTVRGRGKGSRPKDGSCSLLGTAMRFGPCDAKGFPATLDNCWPSAVNYVEKCRNCPEAEAVRAVCTAVRAAEGEGRPVPEELEGFCDE